MARSQFNFVIALPDAQTNALEVVSDASVQFRYRNPDPSETDDYDQPQVKVYAGETGSAGNSTGLLTPDANGRVSGWLPDGRYRVTITSTATPAAFSPITRDFDTRSGGEFQISKGGVPSNEEHPQIFFDDDTAGGSPSIKLGSGSSAPDVLIKRSGTNQLTLDAISTGSLSTVIIGDVKLAGSNKVLDVNSSRIQNTASPLLPTDAANKSYVDASNSNVESSIYGGKIHNLPLLTPTSALTAASTNSIYFSKLNLPIDVSVASLEFFRASGNNSVTLQFGLFAEYNDFSATHKMICLAASKVEISTWDASTKVQSFELPIGRYVNIDEDEDLEFVEEPFYYGDWIINSGLTGSIYAGIVSSGNTVAPLGASITSPILSQDLGIDETQQLPLFAGISAGTLTLSGSSYYQGADMAYSILGTLTNTSELELLSANIGDAYIIDDSIWVYGASSEWYEAADAIDFPTRSDKVPFVRVKV